MALVSVPIRGLFNLTNQFLIMKGLANRLTVSVPIRGLFNLTLYENLEDYIYNQLEGFRPHQGII